MPKVFKFVFVLVIIFSFFVLSIRVPVLVFASPSCSVGDPSPNVFAPNSTGNINIYLSNSGLSTIQWVKIDLRTSDFTINSGSASGWTGTVNSTTQITFSGGSLNSSSTLSISLNITATDHEVTPVYFDVTASESTDGSSSSSCDAAGVSIVNDSNSPVISSLAVSASSTSAVVTWTTDEGALSSVDYGETSGYGTTASDSSYTSSHSISLSSLSASTTYHFKVTATDSSGNASDSGDQSFTTGAAGTITTITTTTTVTNTVTSTITKLIEDTEKPVIALTTSFKKTFTGTPKITGKVTDNAGVSIVEYSRDGGENWLPVIETTGLNSKTVNFEFTIFNLQDGNYKLKVKATDLSGNVQITDNYLLVFDRLPPLIGGSLYSLGSQILTPTGGTLKVIADIDFRLTTSAVGGPTEIRIIAECKASEYNCRETAVEFPLAKNDDTGLWSGVIRLDEPNIYKLIASLKDGAENKTIKDIGEVQVLPKGQVILDPLSKLNYSSAEYMSVFYYESSTSRFIPWDGPSYGQVNPIRIETNGDYGLILPKGKYYLAAFSKNGLLIGNSEIFNLEKTEPINTVFNFGNLNKINIAGFSFGMPEMFQKPVSINRLNTTKLPDLAYSQLVGSEFPAFELKDDISTFDSFYFRGKPTIYSFVNTWHPQTSEQLKVLENIPDISLNKTIIVPQETGSKVNVYKKIGKYDLSILADPDGDLFNKLDIHSLPVHFLVDKKGIVKEVIDGFIDSEHITSRLLGN